MSKKNILIDIRTEDENPIILYKEIVDNELRIKFIHNFEQAVEFGEKILVLDKDTKLTINYRSDFSGEFDDRIQKN
ncbi:hypothetical protein D3C87_78480 [compost metagenome]